MARRAATMTLARADRYPTRADFAEVLRHMPAFQYVVPGVRRLMARTTLRRCPDGDGYVLRCPREYEARIYRYGGQYAALIDFGALACPTMVMGADPDIPHTYFPTTELHHIPTVDYAYLPGERTSCSWSSRRRARRRPWITWRRAACSEHGGASMTERSKRIPSLVLPVAGLGLTTFFTMAMATAGARRSGSFSSAS